MIILTKITYKDDKDASFDIDVKHCQSFDDADKSIKASLKEGLGDFGLKGLKEIASTLVDDGIHTTYDGKTFVWDDNGKGEEYIISVFDPYTRKYQNIRKG